VKVNITLPIYNEEKQLVSTVETLRVFLKNFPYEYEILIADNASNDKSPEIGRQLDKKYKNVEYYRIKQKGRGRALKRAWRHSNCDIVSYMDIDLSTDLKSFPLLINACINHDFSTGSRFHRQSKVDRSLKRELLSRVFALMPRTLLGSKVRDYQCGFKAAKRKKFLKILPLIKNNNWFFDTEMLVLAQRKGFSVKEVPVKWIEDRTRVSKVKIGYTIREYVFNILRMMFKL